MLNDPAAFREEMIGGFVAAYSRYVRRVPGASGIASRHAPAPGKVALVVGGGSGHYPAFYGYVGRGMASAAAIGDIFASPSGEHAYRVAKAVDGGAGILFAVGNFSGDVMNFGVAATRLNAEGIPARLALTTDDVLSARAPDIDRRRGVAGGFYVFKAAGASAARGDALPDVEAIARHVNARTRSVGVAFAGCTVPGQTEPLFTVPDGMMAIGLGIHGEPGIDVTEVRPAREIARLMVDTIIAEAPREAGTRLAVLLNGLGGTKYEEMFVLYHGIDVELRRAGIEPVTTHIGEFVTSLDMAGCSLTFCWMDDELEALFDAPASTPAFTHIARDGAALADGPVDAVMHVADSAPAGTRDEEDFVPGGDAGRLARACLQAAFGTVVAHEAELGRLDAAAGDGDHGAGMVRGFRGAVEVVGRNPISARETLVRAGSAFTDAAGGASGALIGACLVAIGEALPADDASIDGGDAGEAVAAGLAAVRQLGGVEPGDKTMVDTLDPFVAALRQALREGASIGAAWVGALPAAEVGMQSTTDMVARRGRAAQLGMRSQGTPDAGATSTYYILRAIGDVLRAVDRAGSPPSPQV